jgi:hypothetical protein
MTLKPLRFSPGRVLTPNERVAIEQQLRAQGRLQASADDLLKLRRRKAMIEVHKHAGSRTSRQGHQTHGAGRVRMRRRN